MQRSELDGRSRHPNVTRRQGSRIKQSLGLPDLQPVQSRQDTGRSCVDVPGISQANQADRAFNVGSAAQVGCCGVGWFLCGGDPMSRAQTPAPSVDEIYRIAEWLRGQRNESSRKDHKAQEYRLPKDCRDYDRVIRQAMEARANRLLSIRAQVAGMA